MDRKKIIIHKRNNKRNNKVSINNRNIIENQSVNDDTYNGLELFIKNSIKQNISLPDILKNETYKDTELKTQLLEIYHKLISDTIVNPKDEESDKYESDDEDLYSDEYESDEGEHIIYKDEANIKREEIQQLYINNAYTELQINKRVMIVGPTGFGKTVVNYKLIDKLKPAITFIFTPRQNLNKQTLDIKYIKYLSSNNYEFYNYSPEKQSNSNKFNNLITFINKHKKKNRIVLLCYQSCKSLLPQLLKIKFKIDLAICDEAHTRSSWALLSKVYHKLFLELNNKLIEKYIFTTATPKSDMKISPYNNLFGKVIEHCQIYELIQWGILCDFETIVKNIDFDKKKLDLPNFIIETMIKYKRNKGVIYVNSQKNAMVLYAYIKNKYPDYNTFIYISQKLTKDSFEDFKDFKFNKDDTNIECFESCSNPCIIITCNKISYGYDNVFIDLICFADPRQSEEDNRQITGRGLRNDISKYPDKYLLIIVPTSEKHLLDKYQTINNKDNIYIEYKKLKAFLEFVIGSCGKDIIDGRICSRFNKKKPSQISLRNPKDYSGDIIPGEIIKELSTTFYRKYEKFLGFLRNHNVYNEETYNLIRERPENIEWMPLLGNIRTTYKKFCFLDIKSPENINYYQTLEECNKAYENSLAKLVNDSNGNYKSISDLKKNKTESQINKKILEIDSKIPTNIELYYNSIDDD